jgi:hypothetical protein
VKPWVSTPQNNPAPDGAKEFFAVDFLPPLLGLEIPFNRFTHGCTVGYFLAPLRGWQRNKLPATFETRTGGAN